MNTPLLNLLLAALIAGVGLGLFWPQRGLFWRWRQTRRLTRRVLIEDTLKHLYSCTTQGRRPTLQSIAGALHTSIDTAAELIAEMASRELVISVQDSLDLTPQGRQYALQIIRAHRLWERYLADETGIAAAEWHGRSEHREHELTLAETDALAAALGHPRYDPHGDPIPTASGKIWADAEPQSLSAFPLDTPAQIVHLEDEPETVYAQLLAEGFHLHMPLVVTESSPQRICIWAAGEEHVLAPIVAANISVVPLPAEEAFPLEAGESLADMQLGETAQVVKISPRCRGSERRRFLDLGILPGTTITAEMRSPSGDPTAYRVRGALICLRHAQAGFIEIMPLPAAQPQQEVHA